MGSFSGYGWCTLCCCWPSWGTSNLAEPSATNEPGRIWNHSLPLGSCSWNREGMETHRCRTLLQSIGSPCFPRIPSTWRFFKDPMKLKSWMLYRPNQQQLTNSLWTWRRTKYVFTLARINEEEEKTHREQSCWVLHNLLSPVFVRKKPDRQSNQLNKSLHITDNSLVSSSSDLTLVSHWVCFVSITQRVHPCLLALFVSWAWHHHHHHHQGRIESTFVWREACQHHIVLPSFPSSERVSLWNENSSWWTRLSVSFFLSSNYLDRLSFCAPCIKMHAMEAGIHEIEVHHFQLRVVHSRNGLVESIRVLAWIVFLSNNTCVANPMVKWRKKTYVTSHFRQLHALRIQFFR